MPRGRVPDSDRDVYGEFAVKTVNAIRLAMRSQDLMSDDELEIVKAVYDALIRLDPHAKDVARAKIIVRIEPPKVEKEWT